MDGPFSRDIITSILRGPFFVSPLIVSVQPQGLGEPDKLRVCCHLSKSNKLTTSVNSHIKKEDFPTRFDTASRVADIVSIPIFIDPDFLFSPNLSLYLFPLWWYGTSRIFLQTYNRGYHLYLHLIHPFWKSGVPLVTRRAYRSFLAVL